MARMNEVEDPVGEDEGLAVGAEAGTLRFTVGLDCINRAAVGDERFVEVPVTTLDQAVGERAATLIKVDVEGYEGAVLAGGMQAFGAASAVIMELNGQTGRYGQDVDALRSFAPPGPLERTAARPEEVVES